MLGMWRVILPTSFVGCVMFMRLVLLCKSLCPFERIRDVDPLRYCT